MSMIENAKRMGCGNCGGQTFAVYDTAGRGTHFAGKKLVVECLSCKSTSIITMSKPELLIEWGEDSDGILCV